MIRYVLRRLLFSFAFAIGSLSVGGVAFAVAGFAMPLVGGPAGLVPHGRLALV
jgi:hypothetical protein